VDGRSVAAGGADAPVGGGERVTMSPPSDAERAPRRALMLVEDDEEQALLARACLEDAGYVVHTAANGAEALAVLPSIADLGLVIVDLQMPVMDGRTLIRRLRSESFGHSVPIVVWSSDEFDPPSRITELVRKPAELSRLLTLVRLHCGE
jgi:CheY-like chemotaxis protein